MHLKLKTKQEKINKDLTSRLFNKPVSFPKECKRFIYRREANLKTIIIADDMTGANVSNSLLAASGYTVATISNNENIAKYQYYDSIGIHTDSRGMDPKKAYRTVREEMRKLKELEVNFFNKRIDSTLRGNNRQELDAMLDELGEDTVAIVVPAFPDSNKIVIGNYMMVDDVPLELTDVRNDPTSPITSSRVIKNFQGDSDREIGVISMETIMLGREAIADNIVGLKENGAQIIIIDATTNENIELIAKATLDTGLKFVSVDPGPFTYHLVKESSNTESIRNKQKMLFVIGSVSEVTISQIARFRAEMYPHITRIDAKKLLNDESREEEIDRVVNRVIEHSDKNQMFLVATMIEKEDKIDLKAAAEEYGITVSEASQIISHNVALIGTKIAKSLDAQLGGIYSSGGDITQGLLNLTNTTGIQIKDEIIPLAVYGTIMDGDLDKKAIVTKGGLIGDQYTLTRCAEFLQTKIANRYYEPAEAVEQ